LIGRILWGIAWAGIWLGGSTVVLDLATDKNRGRLSGRFQMWFFIGVGVSSILAGVLTDALGYVDGLRVSAAIALVMGLVWLLFLPETRPTSDDTSADNETTASAASASEPPGKPRLQSPFALATAIALLGVNWLIFIGVIGATMPLLLQDRIGNTAVVLGFLIPLATLTGALTASNQLLSLVASPLSGWLTDLTGNRWGLVLLSCLLGAISLGAIAVGGGLLLVLATLFSAISAGIMQTQVMTLIGDHTAGNRHGRMLGILSTAGDLGSATGPLLAYALLPEIGLDGIFWLMAGILALSIPWVTRLAWQEVQLHRSAMMQ
jgi:MFS family permease